MSALTIARDLALATASLVPAKSAVAESSATDLAGHHVMAISSADLDATRMALCANFELQDGAKPKPQDAKPGPQDKPAAKEPGKGQDVKEAGQGLGNTFLKKGKGLSELTKTDSASTDSKPEAAKVEEAVKPEVKQQPTPKEAREQEIKGLLALDATKLSALAKDGNLPITIFHIDRHIQVAERQLAVQEYLLKDTKPKILEALRQAKEFGGDISNNQFLVLQGIRTQLDAEIKQIDSDISLWQQNQAGLSAQKQGTAGQDISNMVARVNKERDRASKEIDAAESHRNTEIAKIQNEYQERVQRLSGSAGLLDKLIGPSLPDPNSPEDPIIRKLAELKKIQIDPFAKAGLTHLDETALKEQLIPDGHVIVLPAGTEAQLIQLAVNKLKKLEKVQGDLTTGVEQLGKMDQDLAFKVVSGAKHDQSILALQAITQTVAPRVKELAIKLNEIAGQTNAINQAAGTGAALDQLESIETAKVQLAIVAARSFRSRVDQGIREVQDQVNRTLEEAEQAQRPKPQNQRGNAKEIKIIDVEKKK